MCKANTIKMKNKTLNFFLNKTLVTYVEALGLTLKNYIFQAY